jgi:hypothetical protein
MVLLFTGCQLIGNRPCRDVASDLAKNSCIDRLFWEYLLYVGSPGGTPLTPDLDYFAL